MKEGAYYRKNEGIQTRRGGGNQKNGGKNTQLTDHLRQNRGSVGGKKKPQKQQGRIVKERADRDGGGKEGGDSVCARR